MVTHQVYGAHRLAIETGGFVKFDVQLTNSPHRHDYFEVCLALEGRGEYHHAGRKFEITPGTVFLAEPGVVHEITSFVTRDLHLYFITLTLQSLHQKPVGIEDGIVDSFQSARNIVSYGNSPLSDFTPLLNGHSQFAAKSALAIFTLELLNCLCVSRSQDGLSEPTDEISQAIAYIDRHLTQKIRVENIADAIGVSDRTLRRRFRERSGSTIAEEINHRRMRLGAHRLLMGFGVNEVAEFVGIGDAGQFSRSFRRAFGMSPKQFQTSYRPGTLAHKTRPGEDYLGP